MTKFNKKIFNEMMNAEVYVFQNSIYILKRWTKDALGNEVDSLELRLKQINGLELSFSREIKGRTFDGIKGEITTALSEMFAEVGKELAKRFENGAL